MSLNSREAAFDFFANVDVSTPRFSLTNYDTYARVVSIHDGDTMSVIIPLFDRCFKFSIRLFGIDTCEKNSKNQMLHTLSQQAHTRLFNLITDMSVSLHYNLTTKYIDAILANNVYMVYLKCKDFDKFGRVLAETYKNKDDTMSF